MTPDELAAVEARAAAATEGPWWATEDLEPGDPDTAVGVSAGDADDGLMIVVTPGGGSFEVGPTSRENDAVFIAAAREDIPRLVAEVKQLQAERDAARNALAEMMGPFPSARAVDRARYVLATYHAETGQPPPEANAPPELVRDPECVARWPECYPGEYDPRCCRFPKSCSCNVLPTETGQEAER